MECIETLVMDLTGGGTLRTALAKVISSAALWDNRSAGPEGLCGYKGATMSRSKFEEVLQSALYIELRSLYPLIRNHAPPRNI